jgi:hypothetical protein
MGSFFFSRQPHVQSSYRVCVRVSERCMKKKVRLITYNVCRRECKKYKRTVQARKMKLHNVLIIFLALFFSSSLLEVDDFPGIGGNQEIVIYIVT